MNSHSTVFDCSRQIIIKRTALYTFSKLPPWIVVQISQKDALGKIHCLINKILACNFANSRTTTDVFLGYLCEISGTIIHVVYDYLCISYSHAMKIIRLFRAQSFPGN